MKKKIAIILSIIVIAILIVFALTTLLSNTGAVSTNNANHQLDLPTSGPNDKSPTPSPSTSSQTLTSSPTPTPSSNQAASTTPTPTAAPTMTPTPVPTATPTPTSTPIPTPSPLPTPNPASLIFSDSFQSGNTNAWTNTDSLGVTIGVKNSMLECSTNSATSNYWGYVYRWLNQTYRSLDWRWYVYFGNLPTTDGNIIGAGGIYNSAIEGNFTTANIVCSLNVVHQNGANYWSMDFVNGTTIYSLNSTSTVLPNTWYLVELNAVQGAGNGQVHLFLNDVETLNATGLTNDNNSGIDHVSVGGGITADQAISWYCASAAASTQHVGPTPSVAANAFSLNPQVAMTGPILLSGLMAVSVISTAFATTGMMLNAKRLQTLTKSGISQSNQTARKSRY